MDVGVCIGDLVSFTNQDNGGFLSTDPGSGTKSAISCTFSFGEKSRLEDSTDPLDIINRNVLMFEVCATNKYKAIKNLQKLRQRGASKAEIKQAEVETEEEIQGNEKSSKSQLGRKVYYGQTIQLRSVSTQKYLDCGRQQQVSDENKDLKTVNLSGTNGRPVQFKFVQKASNDETGVVVRSNDIINIEAVKESGQFLHVSPSSTATGVSKGLEVNLSPTGTDFKISRGCQHTISINGFHTGEVIQICQKKLNSVLVAESHDNSNGSVFFQKVSNADKRKGDVKTGPYDCFWQIDIVKAGDGMLHGDNLCRLLHMSTQMFLCQDNEKYVLSTDKTDRRTLFKLQSSTGKTKFLQDNCSVQMKNIGANNWLSCSKETLWKNRVTTEKESVFLGTIIESDKLQCQMTCSSKQKGGADVFQIKKVDSQTKKQICAVQELLTRAKLFLQKLAFWLETSTKTRQIEKDQQDSTGNIHHLLINIEEINSLLMTETSKLYQQVHSFVCESRLLKCLFKLMGYLPTGQRFNERLYTSAADLVVSCFRGSSPQNKLFGVQYLDFCFQEIHNKQGPLAVKPLSILIEIFEDNDALINKINEAHIDKIFDLFRSDKNYLFFKLLGTLSVCRDRPIVKNQVYIANKLTAGDENQELCYLCYMGEQIGMKDNTVYISTSITQPWVELQDVYKTESLHLQYQHQLEFFRVLCQGGNIQTVRRLTTELGFITFDHLRWSLMDEHVSPENRAIYCQLLTVMCIEANREPVYGTIPLAYDLDNLQDTQITTDGQITPIITWVCDVICKNDVLIASHNEQNIFLSSVLDMACSLTLYGYMGIQSTSNMGERVERCFKGIMKLLDGRTDLHTEDQISDTEKKTFKDKDRFKENLSGPGVFMAKISALKVIDVFLEKLKAESLLEYVKFYKGQTVHLQEDSSKYRTLLRLFPKLSLKLIDEDLLIDLAKYEYNDLVQKALDTLNKMFSVTENMLKMAKNVQVLTSQSSRNKYKKIKDGASKLKEALRSGDPLQYKESSQICGTLSDLCTDSHGHSNSFNQMLIFNTGLLDSVFQSLNTVNTQDDIFVLVQTLSRGNSAIQEYLFGKFDVFLNLPNISTLIIQTLIEIFRGNQEVCLKITQPQMSWIFELQARLKQPELIMLLHVIVHPSPGCVLKRNKRMVASYLPMYKNEMSLIGTDNQRDRNETMNNSNFSEYRLAVLDLFASCAEGDMRFQQTFCTEIPCYDILQLLTTTDHMGIKLSYLRFLTCVYVNKERQQLLQNDATWSLIRSFISTIQLVKENATKDHEYIHRHLSLMKLERNTLQYEESMAMYFTEGILLFLKTLFAGRVMTIPQQYQPELDSVDHILQMFVTDLATSLVINPYIQQLLTDAIVGVHSHSSSKENIESILKQLEVKPNVETFSATQSDEEINKKFQLFSKNMYKVYLYGTMDSSQIRGHSLETMHTYLLSTEEPILSRRITLDAFFAIYAPLSTYIFYSLSSTQQPSIGSDATTWVPDNEEFRSLVSCFVLQSAKTDPEKYKSLSTICQYSIYSSRQKTRSTRAELDLRCFQILRSVLLDEIKHIPTQFHQAVNKYQSQLTKLRRVQNVLVTFGCVECVFCQIQGEGHDRQTSQALALLSDLLFNRNQSAQIAILKFTSNPSSEYFFKTLHHILQQGIEDYKDRKLQWVPTSNQKSNKTQISRKRSINSGRVSPKMDVTAHTDVTVGDVPNNDSLIMAIKILGDLGGSNEEMKDLLRQQPNNPLSYNLVGDCTVLMTVLCSQLDLITATLYQDIVRTLISLVSGNAENQSTVMDNNGLDAINHILLTWEFSDISMKEIQEIKQLNIMLARTLIEMNYGSQLGSKYADLPKLISEQISTPTLVKEIAVTWKSSQNGGSRSSNSEVIIQTRDSKGKSMMKDLCSQYFLLLSRKLDLIPSDLEESEAIQKVFTKLEKKKTSIELSKDGILQKHYFTKDNMSKPDRDTRQLICEETDRSSAQTKLYDLVKWSAEWTRKMASRKTLASNPFGRSFIQAWLPLNVLLFLLTLTLVIYISVAFTAPDDGSVEFDHPDYKARHGEVVIYVVGGIHNFISTAIFIYFVLVESPTVPVLSHIASIPRQKSSKVEPVKIGVNGNWSDKYFQHQLAMNAFSWKSIYYTVFLACSIAGTILDGYFFSYHLFHVIVISSHLQKLLKVIQNAWKYLVLLAMVMVSIVFVYSIIIFLSFRDYWNDSTNTRNTHNIFQCLISLLHHGLIERTQHANTDFTDEIRYAAFDLGFFLMVTILCLYLALGIIIDSFAEIRNKQERAHHDDVTVCFICNLRISNFDHTTQGFKHHIKKEHNMWDYMAFLQYLDLTSPHTLTGLELFVLQKLQKKELDFFPYQMSQSIRGHKTLDMDLGMKMHQIELRIAEMDARLSREPDLHNLQGSDDDNENDLPALKIDRRTDKHQGLKRNFQH